MIFFFFKQKTAYEMRISDWSSDVCSSDLCYFSPGGAALPWGGSARRRAAVFGMRVSCVARLRPLRRQRGAAAAAKSQALKHRRRGKARASTKLRAERLQRAELGGSSRTVAHGSEPLSRDCGTSDHAIGRASWRERGWHQG